MSAANNPQNAFTAEQVSRLLRALRERSMDGFMLMKQVGLDEKSLVAIVRLLRDRRLIEVSGPVDEKEIGYARLWIPADTVGKVDSLILGQSSFMSSLF